MSTPSSLCMTPEEFYEWEELQLVKHQYYQGRAYSMSGSSITHNQHCINLISVNLKALKMMFSP
jgi:Uma2 family endonuclease